MTVKDLNIVHADPRRLMVSVANVVIDAVLVCLHAPVEDSPASVAWWAETDALLVLLPRVAPSLLVAT